MSVFSAGRVFLDRFSSLTGLAAFFFNKTFGFNRFGIKGKNNYLIYQRSFLKKTHAMIKGNDNCIKLGEKCYLENCRITIMGNDNRIHLGDRVYLKDVEFWIEDNHNEILINNRTDICGKTHLACTEGRKIIIGARCLFSNDIVIRTGDSHSIVDLKGNRINYAQDVVIEDHVWVGHKAMLTKGSRMSTNSIVAAGAVVTRSFEKTNVVVGGNPAQIIRENINWLNERID